MLLVQLRAEVPIDLVVLDLGPPSRPVRDDALTYEGHVRPHPVAHFFHSLSVRGGDMEDADEPGATIWIARHECVGEAFVFADANEHLEHPSRPGLGIRGKPFTELLGRLW